MVKQKKITLRILTQLIEKIITMQKLNQGCAKSDLNCLKMDNFLDCPLTFSGVELKNFCLNSETEEHWQKSIFSVLNFTMSFYGFRVRMLLSYNDSVDN